MLVNFILDSRKGGPHFVLQSVKKIIKKKSIDIYLDSNRKIFFFNLKRQSSFLYFFDILLNTIVILFKLKKYKYFFIYGIYNISPLLAGLFSKKNLYWFILEKPNFFGKIMLLIFSKFNIKFVFIDKKLKKKFNFKKSSIFVPNIDIKFWKKSNIIKKKKYFLITTVGNINKSKNHLNLVKFLSQSKLKFYLYIVGENLINQKKYYYQLKKEIHKFNKKGKSKIFLKGRKNRKEIKTILNYTDLFILPSLTEGLSISLLEAMSMKCICLVSSDSNNSGVINNSNGFIFNLNKESLNKSLHKIYNLSAKQKQKISQNARLTVKNLIIANSFFKLNKN
jgi:hypothetical protein